MIENIEKRVSRCEAYINQMKAQADDILEQGYAEAVAAQDEETAALIARQIRNKKLVASDSEMAPDRPSDKEAWAAYRQALRDITGQQGFPFEIEWPTAPED